MDFNVDVIPMGDRVLLKAVEEVEEVRVSGIILPRERKV